MNKTTWGPEIWEQKIKEHGPIGVILGTGASQRMLDKNTQALWAVIERELLSQIPQGARVLDVGTGPLARFAILLSRAGYAVTGLDGSETTLQNAKQHAGDAVEFMCGDISDFAVDKKFAAIICQETFFHIPAHLALQSFTCFNRALEPGGFALIQFAVLNELEVGWLAWNLFYRVMYLVGKPLFEKFGRRSFYVTVVRNSEVEIHDIARRTGFEVVSYDKPTGNFLFRKL